MTCSKSGRLGVDDLNDDPTVLIEPTAGGLPGLFFQLVPEAN
jgi:hypothetical protein